MTRMFAFMFVFMVPIDAHGGLDAHNRESVSANIEIHIPSAES